MESAELTSPPTSEVASDNFERLYYDNENDIDNNSSDEDESETGDFDNDDDANFLSENVSERDSKPKVNIAKSEPQFLRKISYSTLSSSLSKPLEVVTEKDIYLEDYIYVKSKRDLKISAFEDRENKETLTPRESKDEFSIVEKSSGTDTATIKDEEGFKEEKDQDIKEFGKIEKNLELEEKKREMIENYVQSKYKMRYLAKKNLYLQDRIYRNSLRKGLILEETSPSHQPQPLTTLNNPNINENEQEKDLKDELAVAEDEKESPKVTVEVTKSLHPIKDKKQKSLFYKGNFSDDIKYRKILKKIQNWWRIKEEIEIEHEDNMANINVVKIDWTEEHNSAFMKLIKSMKNKGEMLGIDSKSEKFRFDSSIQMQKKNLCGTFAKKLDYYLKDEKSSLNNYLMEFAKIHKKLYVRLLLLYKNQKSIEIAHKKLENTEIQGHGISMLEYEQLRAENESLKDKLDDRTRDVENIKGKIAHCIEILAHFREKMKNIEAKNKENLKLLLEANEEVLETQKLNDGFTNSYKVMKRTNLHLNRDSGLLKNNPALLDDYEKTHNRVTELKNIRAGLYYEYNKAVHLIEDIRGKMNEIEVIKNIEKREKMHLKIKEIKKESNANLEINANSNMNNKMKRGCNVQNIKCNKLN